MFHVPHVHSPAVRNVFRSSSSSPAAAECNAASFCPIASLSDSPPLVRTARSLSGVPPVDRRSAVFLNPGFAFMDSCKESRESTGGASNSSSIEDLSSFRSPCSVGDVSSLGHSAVPSGRVLLNFFRPFCDESGERVEGAQCQREASIGSGGGGGAATRGGGNGGGDDDSAAVDRRGGGIAFIGMLGIANGSISSGSFVGERKATVRYVGASSGDDVFSLSLCRSRAASDELRHGGEATKGTRRSGDRGALAGGFLVAAGIFVAAMDGSNCSRYVSWERRLLLPMSCLRRSHSAAALPRNCACVACRGAGAASDCLAAHAQQRRSPCPLQNGHPFASCASCCANCGSCFRNSGASVISAPAVMPTALQLPHTTLRHCRQ